MQFQVESCIDIIKLKFTFIVARDDRWADIEAINLDGGHWFVLQSKGNLKQRVSPCVSFRLNYFDQLFEGDILVFIRIERSRCHPSE